MDTFVRGFIRASLAWFGAGVLMGLGMAVQPSLIVIRPAHVHANLLGFVSMMIFGVAYHVIPRFAGAPLHSRRLALAHVWVANAGLALLVGGWIVRGFGSGAGTPLIHIGAAVSAASAALFIYNVWRTLDAAPRFPGSPGSGRSPIRTAATGGRP